MGGGQAVPGPAPRQQRLERDVGVVEDRSVRVAAGDVGREVAVDRLVGAEVVGADDARVPDVDHVRADDVEPAADAEQEHGRDAEHADGDGQAQRRRLTPARPRDRDAEHAREQVDEQRIDERDRDADLGRVEERVGDREREQHREVEVQQPQRRARVGHREQRAQRQPDPPRVGDAAECPGPAARHRPLHLVARPALEHAPAAVVEDGLRQLLRAPMATLGRGVERDLPEPVGLAPVVHPAVGVRVAAAGTAHLRQRRDRLQHGGRRVLEPRRRHVVAGRRAEALGGGARREGEQDAEREERRPHGAGTPKCSRTIGTTSRSDHCGRASRAGPVPHHTSAPSESLACSDPCEPPPTWWSPPQSVNS